MEYLKCKGCVYIQTGKCLIDLSKLRHCHRCGNIPEEYKKHLKDIPYEEDKKDFYRLKTLCDDY